MTKGNYKNNQKSRTDTWKKTKTTAIFLSAIVFVSSSVLTSGSISVLAAASSSNISSINQTKTSHAEFLTRVTQITSAAQAGKLSINIAGVVFNCPIVNVQV